MSGLKTNIAKSELVLVGYVDNAAGLVGCVPALEVSWSSIGGFL